MTENKTLQSQMDMLQRQLRATANLQQLLVDKDRELVACRSHLEQYETPATTIRSDREVKAHDEAIRPGKERKPSKLMK